MRIAHIIMAHKNPEQLLRFVKKLEHPNADIFIHIDKKIPIEEFNVVKNINQVYFIKNRTICNWGGNSFLVAIINTLTEVIESNISYDFINLLSAQDYPIKSADLMFKFLEKNKGLNFISYMPNDSDWWNTATLRYEKYHFTDLNIKYKYFFEKVINLILPKRRFPLQMELYGGSDSSWWTINLECAIEILQFFANNPQLIKFLKYSWCTDEFIIASLIMNSSQKSKTINNNLRYIDWSEGNANPKILTIDDFKTIYNTDKLFARKFDTNKDTAILNLIDIKLLNPDII